MLIINRSGDGLGGFAIGARWNACVVNVAMADDQQFFEIIHQRCIAPGTWRLGLAALESQPAVSQVLDDS